MGLRHFDVQLIDDIDVLGAGIFSNWRYWSHWAMEPIKDDDLRWFAVAFAHLKSLCDERLR